jgi:hypothetical protein
MEATQPRRPLRRDHRYHFLVPSRVRVCTGVGAS